jgi:hypothetical protein
MLWPQAGLQRNRGRPVARSRIKPTFWIGRIRLAYDHMTFRNEEGYAKLSLKK